jgi:hypothetical protein
VLLVPGGQLPLFKCNIFSQHVNYNCCGEASLKARNDTTEEAFERYNIRFMLVHESGVASTLVQRFVQTHWV